MMTTAWYALRSKPHKENMLFGQLKAYGVETYLPVLRVKPVNPRSRKERPYFPGYLFVHVDLAEQGFSSLNWLPGASGLVAFDGEPGMIADQLIRGDLEAGGRRSIWQVGSSWQFDCGRSGEDRKWSFRGIMKRYLIQSSG